MLPARHLSPFVLLLAAGLAGAQGRDGAWVSYRDAYRAMVVFEKYGGAKSLLQNHLQVAPRDKAGLDEGMQLTLAGKSTQLNLPLDATGRAVFPLLKAVYDDNAALVLGHGGAFAVRPRVSIAVRADGVYVAGDLRAGCEQALAFARFVDASLRGRQCVGVRFVFPKKGEARVRQRRGDGIELALPVVEGSAFPGDLDAGFPTASYRFDGERAMVVAYNAPLAIVPLFE